MDSRGPLAPACPRPMKVKQDPKPNPLKKEILKKNEKRRRNGNGCKMFACCGNATAAKNSRNQCQRIKNKQGEKKNGGGR